MSCKHAAVHLAHRECPRIVVQNGSHAFGHTHCHAYCKGSICTTQAKLHLAVLFIAGLGASASSLSQEVSVSPTDTQAIPYESELTVT